MTLRPSTSPSRSTISRRARLLRRHARLPEGRSSDDVDRLRPVRPSDRRASRSRREAGRGPNPVDGHDVPVPHFGVVLTMDDWHALADRVTAAGICVRDRAVHPLQGPARRAGDDVLLDPSGNALEFKAFANDDMIFATKDMALPSPSTYPTTRHGRALRARLDGGIGKGAKIPAAR